MAKELWGPKWMQRREVKDRKQAKTAGMTYNNYLLRKGLIYERNTKMNLKCDECGKDLEFGRDGFCDCGKELCFDCYIENNHRDHNDIDNESIETDGQKDGHSA